MLLEIMHYIYAPPFQPEEPLSSIRSLEASSAQQSSGLKSPSSPHADGFSSPPLLKRSVASPFRPADSVALESTIQNVSRVLPFGVDDISSKDVDSPHSLHQSIRFLITAACIKPILATTFVTTMPSFSLAGAHVSALFSFK
jgi:hypothetical protein